MDVELKILKTGSSGNCYLLVVNSDVLIIEAGDKFKNVLKSLNFNTNKVNGVLITHEHLDHSKYIKEFTNKGINIYTSIGTANKIKLDFFERLEAKKATKVGAFDVLPFLANHDCEEPLNFIIKYNNLKILFITDNCKLTTNFKNIDYLIIETNYSTSLLDKKDYIDIVDRRVLTSHLSLEEAIFFTKNNLKGIKPKKAILIHLSERNSNNSFGAIFEKLTNIKTFVATNDITFKL